MFRSKRPLRALAAVAVAAALAAPPVSRAQSDPSQPASSPIGVVFAVLCGAGININRMAPGVPIVVVVTAASCLGMLVDAMATEDK